MRIRIDNLKIVTMNDEEPIIERGYMVIEKGRVSQVVSGDPVGETASADYDRIINGEHKMALPGFVNAHTHVGMAPFRNYANDLPLEEWLFDKILPMESKLTGDDIFWATQLGIAEMIRTGTTCFADMYWFTDVVAQVVESSGIRADLSRGLICSEQECDIAKDVHVVDSIALFNRFHNSANGRLRVRFGPHSVYTCTPNYLREITGVAKELGVGIHIHLSETERENKDCYKLHGKSPTKHLADLGVFNLPTIAAHGVHLSEDDLSILQEYPVSIVHNPGSNLKLGSGVARIADLVKKGIPVGLGTDGVSSNNNLDMLQEAYLAAVLSKGVFQDSIGIKAYDALKMATVDGAKSLGLADVGQIRPGMKADVILIDIDKPHYYPLNDPISAIIYAGQGSDVDTVIVDGNILYENGEYKTLDIDKIKSSVNRITNELFSSR